MMLGWLSKLFNKALPKSKYMGSGEDLYNLSLTRVGCRYRLGAFVPKDDPGYMNEFDCAELTSWAVYQVSNKLYGCANNKGNPASADAYTGFWKRDADIIGTIISVEQAARTPGAALLRYSGSGLIGHIVFCDGIGGTVEAHSSNTGVLIKKITGRRWDIGILVPWVGYSQAGTAIEVAPPDQIIYRFKDPLMKGEMIGKIQQALTEAGFKTKPDRIYGSKTFYSVRQFQNKMGLVADGEVGSKTLSALNINF